MNFNLGLFVLIIAFLLLEQKLSRSIFKEKAIRGL